jgi:hypothetical protein
MARRLKLNSISTIMKAPIASQKKKKIEAITVKLSSCRKVLYKRKPTIDY